MRRRFLGVEIWLHASTLVREPQGGLVKEEFSGDWCEPGRGPFFGWCSEHAGRFLGGLIESRVNLLVVLAGLNNM